MKFILLVLSLFILASCQEVNEPQPQSNVTSVQSLDTFKVYVDGSTIFITQGMIQSEFIAIVEATDQSNITFRFLTNDNQEKTRSELFEYEKVEVTSEDGRYRKIYLLFYFPEG